MSGNEQPSGTKKWLVLSWIGGSGLILVFLVLGSVFLIRESRQPKFAPESDRVLEAQVGLPFQVLIPAYLPSIFVREKMEIISGDSVSSGAGTVRLTYPTRKGNQMILTEWIDPAGEGTAGGETTRKCMCMCSSASQCSMTGMEFIVGSVHIQVELSVPNLLSYEQMQFILDTLGPAANQQVFTAIQDVPVSSPALPAEEIPINSDGVQEVVLVVSPDGYTPAHFSVVKDIPVRLTFAQLGQVGCGSELVIDWGGKAEHIILDTAAEKKVIEFTPKEAGIFLYHCPHYIYQGVMTVKDE